MRINKYTTSRYKPEAHQRKLEQLKSSAGSNCMVANLGVVGDKFVIEVTHREHQP